MSSFNFFIYSSEVQVYKYFPISAKKENDFVQHDFLLKNNKKDDETNDLKGGTRFFTILFQ